MEDMDSDVIRSENKDDESAVLAFMKSVGSLLTEIAQVIDSNVGATVSDIISMIASASNSVAEWSHLAAKFASNSWQELLSLAVVQGVIEAFQEAGLLVSSYVSTSADLINHLSFSVAKSVRSKANVAAQGLSTLGKAILNSIDFEESKVKIYVLIQNVIAAFLSFPEKAVEDFKVFKASSKSIQTVLQLSNFVVDASSQKSQSSKNLLFKLFNQFE